MVLTRGFDVLGKENTRQSLINHQLKTKSES